jgi:hypothetical protein
MSRIASATDAEILYKLDELDRAELLADTPPKARMLKVLPRLFSSYGKVFTMGLQDPDVERVRELYSSFFRQRDVAIGGLHAGLVVHLDLFFLAYLPLVLGQVQIEVFNCIDMTPVQRLRLAKVPEEEKEVVRQWIDVADIGATLSGTDGFKIPSGIAAEFFAMSAFHNQAATAVMVQAFDYRGAIQSSLLAAELAVKATCMNSGITEKDVKNHIGHDLSKADEILLGLKEYDIDRFKWLRAKLPPFVASRYQLKSWSRRECGEVALAAQEICGMTARQLSGSSFSQKLSRSA